MEKKILPEIITNPEEAALIYVHAIQPGIHRKRYGKKFKYFD